MGNIMSTKIDFSKNIYIKICPTYYQYKKFEDFRDGNAKNFIVSYKKLNKNDIIKFMRKHLKVKNNYILNFDGNDNYSIGNIKTDKNYVIIAVKYKNITKNYNINYVKEYIFEGLHKYFDPEEVCLIKNNIYFNKGPMIEVYQ
jgi:hypothetical protein